MFSKFRRWLAYRKHLRNQFWFILYEDGTCDGGLIRFNDAFLVAKMRYQNGRKEFQIVYWKLGDFLKYINASKGSQL